MSNVLLLVDANALHIGTVRDHVNSLVSLSEHTFHVTDCRSRLLEKIPFDQFDVIVFHYSIVISRSDFVSAELASLCAEFRGLKVLLIQDEYRWINATVKAVVDLGVHVIFTVVNAELIEIVYGSPMLSNVRKEQTLTGFVFRPLLQHDVAAFSERPIEVGYRGRNVPYWLGAIGQEKKTIGEKFSLDAQKYGLKTDIAVDEISRIYAKNWIAFLANCKAVLGTESGAGIMDFSGQIQRNVDTYLTGHPAASFEDVRDRFFKEFDGKHCINVISPRCFEAAALRTLMILYPGHYSGILEPWRHYVPLAKDHSNMEEVVAVLRTPARAQEIIDAAYREVACNPTYYFSRFVAHFDGVVSEELASKGFAAAIDPARSLKYRITLDLQLYMARAWLRRKRIGLPKIVHAMLSPGLRRRIRKIRGRFFRANR